MGLNVKYPIFLSDFNPTTTSLIRFLKNIQVSNFRNIWPAGAKFFHVNGQMDRMKLKVAFRKFVNAPKNS